jgi:hypothetical protein
MIGSPIVILAGFRGENAKWLVLVFLRAPFTANGLLLMGVSAIVGAICVIWGSSQYVFRNEAAFRRIEVDLKGACCVRLDGSHFKLRARGVRL